MYFIVKLIISSPVFWDFSTLISREPRQPGCSHIHSEWGPLSPHTPPPLSSVVCTLGHSNWGKRKITSGALPFEMVFSHLYFFCKDSIQIPACSEDSFLYRHLVEHWIWSPCRFSISVSRLRSSIPLELLVVQGDGSGVVSFISRWASGFH